MSLKNIKSFAAAVMVSAGAFVSCVQMEDQNVAVGYLSAPSLEVDVVVDDLMQTKALDFAIEAPGISEIHYVVKDKDGNTKYDAVGLWAEPLVLPVGAYTIDAYHGENGFDAPYFKGSASGTISPLGIQTPTFSVSLENSLVNVTLDKEFEKHFNGEKVTMASGTIEKEFGEWFYVPSGENIELLLSGRNSTGEEATFTYSLSSPAAKTAYSLVCQASSTNWPSIEWTSTSLEDGAFEGGLYFEAAVPSNVSPSNASMMKYQIKGGKYADWTDVTVENVGGYKYVSGLENDTDYLLRARIGNIFTETELSFRPVSFQSCLSVASVTAAHNNEGNENIELSSTTMTANNMKVMLPTIVADMATVKASGSFSSTNNKATGSFSDEVLSSTAKSVSFTNATAWPYLPQGTYSATVTATCTLNGATYTATASTAPTVKAPVFKVIVSAYTSYDRYLDHTKNISGALDKANDLSKRMLVEERKAELTISKTILCKDNYKDFLTQSEVKYAGETLQSFTVSSSASNSLNYANVTATALGQYEFTATVTFDGTTKTDSHQCHITGLPYTAAPPTSSDWSASSNVNFRSDDVRFGNGGGAGNITLNKLHIPVDINVSVGAKIDAYGAPVNTTTYIEVGGTRLFECTSDSGAFNYKTKTLEDTKSGALTTSNKTVKAGTTYGLGTTRGHIYYINIYYR